MSTQTPAAQLRSITEPAPIKAAAVRAAEYLASEMRTREAKAKEFREKAAECARLDLPDGVDEFTTDAEVAEEIAFGLRAGIEAIERRLAGAKKNAGK